MRCISRDGTTVVERIRLSCTGSDGEWLRVKRHGFHVADVRTVAELAALGVKLTDLDEIRDRLHLGNAAVTASGLWCWHGDDHCGDDGIAVLAGTAAAADLPLLLLCDSRALGDRNDAGEAF
jgi:hypothetical protein